MAPTPLKTENTTVEQYLFIIIIKLAFLSAMKILKVVFKVHGSYKRGLKKKYLSRDIEAAIPKPSTSNAK